MREVAFIKQNKDKWLEVETVLNERKPISPDQMADYYVQLLGDLSFVQTYYPKSNYLPQFFGHANIPKNLQNQAN